MEGERTNSRPGIRDVIGAWLVCIAIALLALGLTSNVHGVVPPAAEITALPGCGSTAAPACALGDADVHTANVTPLHRLTYPAPRQGGQPRAG